MSTLTCTTHRPMIKFVFRRVLTTLSRLTRRGSPRWEAGPVRSNNAVGTRPDDCRDPLPGDKRQPALRAGSVRC
jgi:hypothetical protein